MKKNTTKKRKKLRKWLPSFAELVDRLSIHQLKEVFMPEKKAKYRGEMALILHDLDLLIKEGDFQLSGSMIRTIIIVAQINVHIWYNEAKARKGEEQDLALLRLTHSLNGIRTRAGNHLLKLIDDGREEHKTDCLAAEHSIWDIDFILQGEQNDC